MAAFRFQVEAIATNREDEWVCGILWNTLVHSNNKHKRTVFHMLINVVHAKFYWLDDPY